MRKCQWLLQQSFRDWHPQASTMSISSGGSALLICSALESWSVRKSFTLGIIRCIIWAKARVSLVLMTSCSQDVAFQRLP